MTLLRDRRRPPGPPLARVAALLAVLAGVGASVVAADGAAHEEAPAGAGAPPPEATHPFAAWLPQLVLGTPLRVPGAVVVPLSRPGAVAVPGRVSLRGSLLRAIDLPAPAGEVYLRVENPSSQPVEVLVGEALLTAAGPGRVVSRQSWIPAAGSVLVPVALQEPAPEGPYASRGLGLSPREQELLSTRRWVAELELRNRLFGVEDRRLRDASAAYPTEAFGFAAGPQRKLLSAPPLPDQVGLCVVDERGLAYVRLAADPARWRAEAPLLLEGLALDAARAVAGARAPQDRGDAALRARLTDLLDALGGPGTARPWFGGATLTWWRTPAFAGRWEGLSVGTVGVSLTWRHDAPPERVETPPPPPRPTPPTPPEAPPTPTQVGRDPRPTPADERRADRREGGGGGRGPLR